MDCQKRIDDLLKRDFKISSKYILPSSRLAMESRKQYLMDEVQKRFNDLLSESDYLNVKHQISNGIAAVQVFSNKYFELVFRLRIEQKNIISAKYIVDIEFNQYKISMKYSDFYTTPYCYLKQMLLNLDKYNFCFIKSKFENIVAVQQCFI